MKSIKTNVFTTLTILFGVLIFSSCKNDDPSLMKIYVRNAGNELIEGARVVIIGDVESDPVTLSYVDTVSTNSSGFAEINLNDYFTKAGEENSIAFFDVLVKKDLKESQSYIRCRSKITTVETIYLPN